MDDVCGNCALPLVWRICKAPRMWQGGAWASNKDMFASKETLVCSRCAARSRTTSRTSTSSHLDHIDVVPSQHNLRRNVPAQFFLTSAESALEVVESLSVLSGSAHVQTTFELTETSHCTFLLVHRIVFVCDLVVSVSCTVR